MIYFFDTDDGEKRVRDGSGTDLPDEAEALDQAVSLLRDLSHAAVVPGTERAFSVMVRGPDGAARYAATLRLKVDRVG